MTILRFETRPYTHFNRLLSIPFWIEGALRLVKVIGVQYTASGRLCPIRGALLFPIGPIPRLALWRVERDI